MDVACFGLLSDFAGRVFPCSGRLVEMADVLVPLPLLRQRSQVTHAAGSSVAAAPSGQPPAGRSATAASASGSVNAPA